MKREWRNRVNTVYLNRPRGLSFSAARLGYDRWAVALTSAGGSEGIVADEPDAADWLRTKIAEHLLGFVDSLDLQADTTQRALDEVCEALEWATDISIDSSVGGRDVVDEETVTELWDLMSGDATDPASVAERLREILRGLLASYTSDG